MYAHREDRTASGCILRAFRDTRGGRAQQVFVATLAKPTDGALRNEDVAETRVEIAEDPDAPGRLLVTVRGRRAGDVRVVAGEADRG